MDYLRSAQTTSGGFSSYSIVNSQSTGLVLQGLAALGRSHASLRKGGNTGLDFIEARQQADGSIWYSRNSDQTKTWVTADALVGLAGESLPVAEPARRPSPEADSGGGSDGGTSDPGGSGTGSSGGFTPDVSPSAGSAADDGSSSAGGAADGSSPDTSVSSDGDVGPVEPGGTTAEVPSVPGSSTPELAPVIPEPPSEALLAASRTGDEPSPAVATLIFLLVSGGLAGGTVLLVRRMKW
jgi:hypothetical protein